MKKLIATTIFTLLLTISSFTQVFTDRDFESAPEKETKYDKFKDETTTSLKFQLTRNLSLTFDDTFEGKKRTSKLTEIRVSFISSDTNEGYLIARSCIFLADDNRIRLNDGNYLSAYGGEALGFSISLENFRKIANAKKLEMQLGSREFGFSKTRLDAIKEFYKQLVP